MIIVSWNTRDLTLAALRTLLADLAAHGPAAQVWVVDNASSDGTAAAIRAQYPEVQVIASEENLGFAGGNNLALRTLGFAGETPVESGALPRAVFLLNSDTLTHGGATRALYDALFSAPDIGLVGARLTYEDGAFQHSAFRFPGVIQTFIDLFPVPGRLYESAFNGRYARRLYDGEKPFAVDHMLGATMMLRREVIQQVGLFDEQFFMYCEEIDWSMRIRRAGWAILCVPTAHITHLEGQSTSQVRPASVKNLWTSRFQLYEKHYAPWRVALIRRIVRAGMRRKIREAEKDGARGALPAEQRDALIAAYRAVMAL